MSGGDGGARVARRGLREAVKALAHLPRDLGRLARRRLGLTDPSYARWIATQEALSPRELALLRRRAAALAREGGPLVSVLAAVDAQSQVPLLAATLGSLERQAYAAWEVCVACDPSACPEVAASLALRAAADPRVRVAPRVTSAREPAAVAALAIAAGSHVALLRAGDELAPTALYWIAEALAAAPGAALVYSDEDAIGEDGARSLPWFKCDLNHDLLLAQDLVSHLAVVRAPLARELGGFRAGLDGAEGYDLALRVVERAPPGGVVHVPRVLLHRRAARDAGDAVAPWAPTAGAAEPERRAVEAHLRRRGVRAEVLEAPECPGLRRVRYALPEPAPRVLVVVPTRDRLDLLAPCIESVTARTRYPDYAICVVDNGSVEPATQGYLATLRAAGHAVLRDDGPFNFSRLNNRAVRELGRDAELVCLLNNDTEIVSPGWLEELAAHALQPGVGCVGARLWYPDGRLQHGGVILGPWRCAGHAHRFLPRGEPGYAGRAALQQSFSAVTAACLVVRRELYDAVGGLDESFPIAFNDVDLCLRIRAAGHRNVWTPYAELLHHESVTRGAEDTAERRARFGAEVERLRARWAGLVDDDPCYSPHLTLEAEDFSRAARSRVPRTHPSWSPDGGG